MTWTPEKVTRLRSMFAAGATRTQMAEALGFADRGAVCGKLNRMGLTGTGPSARTQPNGTTSDWTKDHERRLIEMWPDWSISAAQIARELGGNLTRSSVSNRARRLIAEGKLKPRGRVLTGRRKPKGKHGNHALGYQIKARSKAPIAPSAPSPEPAPELVIPIAQRCSLMELTDETCKWPIGDPGHPDFFFCGGKSVEGRPYCGYHSRVAYRPPNPR